MANVSLDDIIRSKSSGMRGRGGIGRHTSRGARINGSMRGRVGGMGGPQIVTDARMKIIQKNREKLTDARDKLAEIAKQSDARLKLEKIRAMQLRKEPPSLPTISRKTGRNGRLALTTNKVNPPFMQSSKVPPPLMPTNYMPPMSTRTVGYRNTIVNEPHYGEDINMDYDGDYMMDAQVLRRTVSNEYAPTLPPPPPPVFNLTQASSPFNWKATTSGNIIQENPRSTRLRKINDSDRTRDFKVVARPSSMEVKSEPRSYREDWTFGTKSRTILPEDTLDSKYYDMRNHRDIGVKSRLDAVSNKSRSMGALPRPKTSPSSGPSQSTGYRIVVSNLQANVTQEDIKELFEDVGELLVSRLVRPGTAEVIYKTLKDATKAVETYHNRQLDGHPMKCLLVNPRPKNNPTGPAVRPIAESRRNASSSYVQPSLGAVYRALFDDS